MIFLKTEDEIELLRQSNLLVGKTLAEVAKLVKPGVTTRELDKVAEEFIRDNGGQADAHAAAPISLLTLQGAVKEMLQPVRGDALSVVLHENCQVQLCT